MNFRALGVGCGIALAIGVPVRAAETIGPGAIGVVIRDSDQRAIVGARVVVDGPVAREATTIASGVVTLDALPLGTYAMHVSRAGFESYTTRVILGGKRSGIFMLNIRMSPMSFANLRDSAGTVDVVGLSESADPIVAHALVANVDANVVAGATAPQTRRELDGIPLAGGAASFAGLRAVDGLGLERVEIVRGPVSATSSLRDTIGGIVNFRTPGLTASSGERGLFGYDSSIGSFTSARTHRTFGKFALLADLTSGATFRSQTFKLRYAPAPSFAIALARYDTHATVARDISTAHLYTPIVAVDLHTRLGVTSLDLRSYTSASHVAENTPVGDARIRGLQAIYAIAAGENLVTLRYDRRDERDRISRFDEVDRRFTTLGARADLRLSDHARLTFGDAYARGTGLQSRNDPFIAYAVRPDARTTVRFAEGSAYATSDATTPVMGVETSFGYRLGIEEALPNGAKVSSSVDRLNIFSRFGAAMQARELGFEIGYDRPPVPGRLDGAVMARFERLRPFGQTGGTDLRTPRFDDGTLAFERRIAIGYSRVDSSVRFGLTSLGTGNATVGHPITLGDVRVHFTLANALDVHVGIENVFGADVADSRIAPYFAPREYRLTIGAATEREGR